jgi:hypothetical protein
MNLSALLTSNGIMNMMRRPEAMTELNTDGMWMVVQQKSYVVVAVVVVTAECGQKSFHDLDLEAFLARYLSSDLHIRRRDNVHWCFYS